MIDEAVASVDREMALNEMKNDGVVVDDLEKDLSEMAMDALMSLVPFTLRSSHFIFFSLYILCFQS